MGRFLDALLWFVMFVVVIIATFTTIMDLGRAQSAPQQAAAAAMGLFGVITPYVIVRMLHSAGVFGRREETDKRLDRMARHIEEMAQTIRESEARQRKAAALEQQRSYATDGVGR